MRIDRAKFPTPITFNAHLFISIGVLMFKAFTLRCRLCQVLNKNQFIETQIHS